MHKLLALGIRVVGYYPADMTMGGRYLHGIVGCVYTPELNRVTRENVKIIKRLLACIKTIGADGDAAEALALVSESARRGGRPSSGLLFRPEPLEELEGITSTLKRWREDGSLAAAVTLAEPYAATEAGCDPEWASAVFNRLHRTALILLGS